MSEALVRMDETHQALDRVSPRDIISQATEEANVLAEVINGQGLFSMISGKKFVKVEGWVTLATLRGCLPREVSVEEMPEGRYVATVELVRMNDGAVLSRASAECGGPEDQVWASRPPNARRSMAITRATGKVCRIGFSWVMAMSGFEVTPAEEMDFAPVQRVSENAAVRTAAARTDTRPTSDAYIFTFGKHNGEAIVDVPRDYLDFMLKYSEDQMKDPAKAKFKTANKEMMDRVLRELNRRAQNAVQAPVVDEGTLPF